MNEMQQRGIAEIEQTHNMTFENHAKDIFLFNSDQFNYFQSNYQPFDTLVDGDYRETLRQ